MSKAQTDIRSTSYDALNANPNGYVGTIDDALAQIRRTPSVPRFTRGYAREELLNYLGVKASYSNGPSVQLDQDVSYGAEDVTLGVYDPVSMGLTLGIFDPGFYGLANAKARGWL